MKTPPLQKEGVFFCWDGKKAAVACRRKKHIMLFQILPKTPEGVCCPHFCFGAGLHCSFECGDGFL